MNTGAEAVETALKVAPQVGLPGQGRARRTRRTSSSWRATSTAAPRPSSASPTTRSPATSTGPTHRDSARSPTGMPRRCATPSTTPPSPCCSSRCRGRAASSSRPQGYLREVRAICDEAGALMVADEIQSRPRPHRPHLRVRPRGRRAGHLRPRQGARRWPLPGLRHRRRPRGARGHHPGVARVDLRRQPARGGDRPRGRHDARRGRVPAPGRPPRRRPRAKRLAPLVGRPGGDGLRGRARARVCGRASTSSRAAPAVASCASG